VGERKKGNYTENNSAFTRIPEETSAGCQIDIETTPPEEGEKGLVEGQEEKGPKDRRGAKKKLQLKKWKLGGVGWGFWGGFGGVFVWGVFFWEEKRHRKISDGKFLVNREGREKKLGEHSDGGATTKNFSKS